MEINDETIAWAYRLFLDREPENQLVVNEKLKIFSSTHQIRKEFIESAEFKQKNPGFHTLAISGHEPAMYIESISDLCKLFEHIKNVWEHLGETEPFWSVISDERFQTSNIEDNTVEFYGSASENVDLFIKTLERNSIDISKLKSCLEYGCGVGRVTYWLSKRFDAVWGYDISRSHLNIAKRYLNEAGVTNVSFQHIGEPHDIENLPKVDVIYSVIVLQHNPPPIIQLIIREMIRALNPGGIAFFQVPTYRMGYRFSLQEYFDSEGDSNQIEMHVFPQNEIFNIISRERGQLIEVLEDKWTNLRHGERSNTFLIKKLE